MSSTKWSHTPSFYANLRGIIQKQKKEANSKYLKAISGLIKKRPYTPVVEKVKTENVLSQDCGATEGKVSKPRSFGLTLRSPVFPNLRQVMRDMVKKTPGSENVEEEDQADIIIKRSKREVNNFQSILHHSPQIKSTEVSPISRRTIKEISIKGLTFSRTSEDTVKDIIRIAKELKKLEESEESLTNWSIPSERSETEDTKSGRFAIPAFQSKFPGIRKNEVNTIKISVAKKATQKSKVSTKKVQRCLHRKVNSETIKKKLG